jgi:hypothetical protein
MADKKISALTSLAQGDVAVTTDVLPIVDTSATETKKVTAAALVGAGLAAGVTSVDINSGSIDGTTIGANSAAAGTFTNLTASGTVSFSGATVSNGGSVTTVDINGGTIDGATIATSDITVGSGKTLNVSAGTLTLADNQISGDKVEGGTINAITINTLTSTAVNATTVDATNVEVTNVKAKDGTAAATIADSTGVVSITANPILSGGTANGVLYLNASKVATSGTGLTFNGANLGVATGTDPATITLRHTGNTSGFILKNFSGSEAQLVNADNGPMVFKTNDTEFIRLTAGGNLGIGTSTPSAPLVVNKNGWAYSGNATLTGVFVDGSGNKGVALGYDNTSQTGIIYPFTTSAASSLSFWTYPGSGSITERMRLDSSGNLGLGVTPSAWGSGWKALQIGSGGPSIWTDSGRAFYSSNVYFDGTNRKYVTTNAAVEMAMDGGAFQFKVAPSGTAGNTITFTQAMTLDASGNLLVGTTSGSFTASGRGNITVNGSSSAVYALQVGGTAKGYAFHDGTDMTVANDANGYLRFNTNATERARITAAGEFVVGSTTSAYTSSGRGVIEVNGSSQSLYGFRTGGTARGYLLHDGTNLTISNDVAAAPLIFQTAASERARITSGGLFGVGTTSPNAEIAAYTSEGGTRISANHGTSGSYPKASGISFGSTATSYSTSNNGGTVTFVGGCGIFGNNTAASNNPTDMVFWTTAGGSPAERARITSGGYFKASDSGSYLDSAGSFHEFRNTNANNASLIVWNSNGSCDAAILSSQASRDTTNNSYYYFSCYNRVTTTNKLLIADSGNVTNTNGSYGTISDAKMKTDIVDAGSQWADIKGLRFRKFKMKDDPSGITQLGVVAQEVEQVSPGLVEEHTDRDGEGNDLGTTTKAVKTSVLLMKAAVALQEAMARIEKLEAEVTALKGA